jgi:Mat/Ecp fimbriae major subunit
MHECSGAFSNAHVTKVYEMLNKMKFAVAASIAAVAMVSGAANAATQTATAEAEILTAVELSSVSNLDFGLIVAGATGGTVTLPVTSDTRTCGTLTCVGTASRGSFQVTNATDGQVVQLSVPTTGVELTGPGTAMPVALSLSNASITFDAAALQTVYIGGALTVGDGQTAGQYSTTFNVTANYN